MATNFWKLPWGQFLMNPRRSTDGTKFKIDELSSKRRSTIITVKNTHIQLFFSFSSKSCCVPVSHSPLAFSITSECFKAYFQPSNHNFISDFSLAIFVYIYPTTLPANLSVNFEAERISAYRYLMNSYLSMFANDACQYFIITFRLTGENPPINLITCFQS